MAKVRTVFVCQSCGYQSPRWLGRCPDCQAWNALVEEQQAAETDLARYAPKGDSATPEPITAVQAAPEPRRSSGIGELDRVLGGGVVPGSVVLIGGDPGIGKSTLVLQALAALARSGTTLYVSGEESPQQIKMRADRLHLAEDRLLVLAETSLERIIAQAKKIAPAVLAIDSIQTVFTEHLGSAPGSIGQVRESAGQLVLLSKGTNLATFLVGHVTKEGSFAGPRVLEHMVDTVLYFEGDRGHSFRILRAVKNRFGSTNEIGVFAMKEDGLQPVPNPSELFLAERPMEVPGSVVIASIEGTRPILVELQALVSPTSFGTPRRTTLGIEPNRAALLIAVLEKKMGLHLLGHDVFVNVAGGVRIDEPAVDLGVVAAVASSFLDKPVDARTLVIGEVGLAGEVRAVSQVDARVREAMKLGFSRCILPESSRRQLPVLPGVELYGVASLAQAWDLLF
ncbi:MAG TPA: DNA repair protein RadA [Candidatus Margulisiibacteriota bacterium]|nr:DNA repair protein RadA [Candidatus Margulisiibacteriota bacterium]